MHVLVTVLTMFMVLLSWDSKSKSSCGSYNVWSTADHTLVTYLEVFYKA